MVSAAPSETETKATRILIVEDEGIIAGHIASRLVRTGYEVAGIAESSEEALQKVDELKPDLVLMDIRIKGAMDGVETTAKMRERHDIPVIYLTAHTDQQTIDRAKVTGAFGFLTKPIHHTSLATAIEMAVHKHRADRTARQQRAWMATILGTMADAMAVVDREGKVQFLNGPAERLSGFRNHEAQQMNIAQILPLEDSTSGHDRGDVLVPAHNGRATIQIPRGLRAVNRSGLSFPIEGEIAPSVDGDMVVGAIVTFRDVTARQAEETELRHHHKMEAVGRLAAGIAHDFNNLLFLILGYTEELLRASALNATDFKSLAEIKKAGENAANITQQLLKFSRKEPLQKVDLNLNDVIRDTEELLRRTAGVSVKWQINLAKDLGPIRADAGQLKQTLMNLVGNSRDAMPKGGQITIATSNVELPRTPIPGASREKFVALTVTDTGSGMSSETAQHLFEPFFTTKQPGSGTGLGLSIVHTIVTDHGGTIHVDSEPGNGATFTIYFPRVVEADAVVEPPAQSTSTPVTILLVEDQVDVRRLLRTYLEGLDCTILEAENGEDAIRVASEFGGPIDLLVTDAVMPKAGGFEVARWLSNRPGRTKILFVSGYAQELVDNLANLPAGARFLPKPFMKRDLLKNISDLLSEQSSLTMRSGV